MLKVNEACFNTKDLHIYIVFFFGFVGYRREIYLFKNISIILQRIF